LLSVAFEADASTAGNSGIPSSQSVTSESPNQLFNCLPFSQLISFPVKSVVDARSQERNKQEARHFTSEDNIRNTSESRRLKTEKQDTTEERNEKKA
jgi:hypothetical protein